MIVLNLIFNSPIVAKNNRNNVIFSLKSVYLVKEEQFDEDNCSDTPGQRLKLNKDEAEFADENNNEESSIENVLMDAIKRKGANK
jgi:hypothetical protein